MSAAATDQEANKYDGDWGSSHGPIIPQTAAKENHQVAETLPPGSPYSKEISSTSKTSIPAGAPGAPL